MFKIVVLFSCLLNAGCHRGIIPISSRGPMGAVKPGSMYVHKRSQVLEESPEIYLRTDELKIAAVDEGNKTGSLVSPDDRRIYLFQEKLPYQVGETVLVKVVSRRLEKKDEANPTAAGQATEENTDELTKELLAALPRFDAGEVERKVIDRVPFRITHVEPNGDAYGFYERQSRDRMDVSFVQVSAKIPYETLLPGVAPTTDDLGEVKWLESRSGDIVEQQSSAWEDEYSLRLSGFSEARSRIAADLETKKAQLAEARNRLKNQIVSFSAQRETMTKERAKILEDNARQNSEVLELEKAIKGRDAELAKLRGTAEPELQPTLPSEAQTTPSRSPGIDPSL